MKTTWSILVVCLCLAGHSAAQNDSIKAPKPLLLEQKINLTRLELKHAFQNNDPAGASLWLDSLARLEDDTYVGVSWDERWLLYYWTDNYGALLSEASQFDAEARAIQSYKVPPPQDSLFEYIDAALFEQRFLYFQNIRHAFLSEEEKVFATLLLEYLLRMNDEEDEWALQLENFELKYPSSQFLPFIQSIKPAVLKPANKAFGLAMNFLSGTWSGELDRSLKPLFGLQFDGYYWVDHWNVQFSCMFGGPKIARDISDGLETWPKNDPTSFASFGLELGYDIINTPKVRMFPAVNGAITFFGPPSVDEESGEEVPEYYDNFEFFEAHLGVSLTADAKLFNQNYSSWGLPKGSYHGIRMRVGYNWLNFGRDIKQLDGNLFYFAIGYNLFGYLEAKR